MSYQVLARKWRPKAFDDLVGQQHVVQALSNALDRDQLHHAYLFTGTRGVGKTTLARILSKALNCEQGISSKPCGVCSACREIDSGRFVDLLEVDAASRTKVDQTRELLDNVPYAPARARFKVYLIDEVHMFSTASFNALLKTLEEPPPHVKFLLATTDPQKVPVTVLSRCLQFNLRRLLPGEIAERLRHVLTTEGLEFAPAALPLLARAADGSMRDGLSLLDQAIAFGGGRVLENEVRTMLGTVSGDLVLNLLDALAAANGAQLLAEIERVAALTPDFEELLRELIGLLHRLALVQQVPSSVAADDPDQARLTALAAAIPAEDIQLYYQVALTGQRDLPLAPDPRAGFEMVLLRALAFRPAADFSQAAAPARPAAAPVAPLTAPPARPAPSLYAVPAPAAVAPTATAPTRVPPWEDAPAATAPSAPAAGEVSLTCADDWRQLAARLPLRGIPAQIAQHCVFSEWAHGQLTLILDPAMRSLRNPGSEEILRAALEQALGTTVKLALKVGTLPEETLAQTQKRELDVRQQAAVELLNTDPLVKQMREKFEAQWVPDSIQPLDD
ncbi:DNA polymerase III subunit gamma/tau [Chromatium okenii]|uniref:DNA polymerase III subunit gamma/tau n=1 Tax=Chromatium okenii TaxID=61644 RepID=UPI001904818B|nr:DNA polymerase III subunit gamma/tau [Chromatium okenii]MBK1640774.1 DNA polymerase III subunit gamma/tau [Chromatium okenii]